MSAETSHSSGFDPYHIDRPAPALLTYYAIVCLLTGPGFPFAFVPMVCKYLTLRYKFDDKGVSMSYGVLFKRETLLTYRRIQDIHVTRGIIQRWLGLATISLQTAAIVCESEAEAERRRQEAGGAFALFGDLRANALFGTPEQVCDRVRRYQRLGVSHFIVWIPERFRSETVATLANEVMPAFAA